MRCGYDGCVILYESGIDGLDYKNILSGTLDKSKIFANNM